MTTPYSVSDNSPVLPADVNQYKNILEGATGYTDTFVMVATTGTNYVIRLGDAVGTNKFSIQNSASVEKAYIDSNGLLSVTSFSASSGSLILPQSATPSQTAEGSVAWDTDDDVLTVGTGSGTKRLGLTRGAGSSATALNEMVYDTTAAQLNVWNGASSVVAVTTTTAFDSIRNSFRTGRRLLAEFTGLNSGPIDNDSATQQLASGVVGTGLMANTGASVFSIAPTNVSGEPYATLTVTSGSSGSIGSGHMTQSSGTPTFDVVVSPAKNPRVLVRLQFAPSSANDTTMITGLVSAMSNATANGAYLRVNTTGNLFFVTRQGGSETTTDLGARPAALTSYEIETVDAGVTWTCRNSTTGVVVATSTTNVPTAATALMVCAYTGTRNTATTQVSNLAYFRCEASYTP